MHIGIRAELEAAARAIEHVAGALGGDGGAAQCFARAAASAGGARNLLTPKSSLRYCVFAVGNNGGGSQPKMCLVSQLALQTVQVSRARRDTQACPWPKSLDTQAAAHTLPSNTESMLSPRANNNYSGDVGANVGLTPCASNRAAHLTLE